MLVLSQYHIFESYKTNIYRAVARLQRTSTVSPLPPFKCNVLRESLSVDSQNIPSATLKEKGVVGNLYISLWTVKIFLAEHLKRRGSWVISIYLCGQSKYSLRNT